MIVHLFLFILGLMFIHFYVRNRRIGQLINKIPGPPSLPFIGNIYQLIGNAEHLYYTLHDILDKHYPIAKIWVTTNPIVLIRHPDDLEILLSSKIEINKGSLYRYLKSWFQDSVLMSEGTKWQTRRKLLTSTFHLDNLKKYINVTDHCTNEMIDQIKSHGQISDQEISPLFYKTLLYAFCGVSLDADLKTWSNDHCNNYKRGMDEFFEVAAYKIVRPYIKDWMMPFFCIGSREKNSLQNLFKLRDELVNKRRQYHEHTGYRFLQEGVEVDDLLGERKKKLSMLDNLLLAERKGWIDEKGLNEEVDIMIATGTETAAVTMVSVVMLLAENKKAQELARKEVNKVLDKTNGKITMAELQKFEYLDRCIKETLRLYATAPFFSRYTQRDIHLKNYTIPAGVEVLCLPNSTHRDPNFWPDPDKFDPDRFLPHFVEKRHPYAYYPFSAGVRNCLGSKLAMILLKILTAKVLYDFYLEPISLTKDLRFNASISLHPTKPVYTKFIAINKSE